MVDSAGLLLYRVSADGRLEVLIGHMGGPFWAARHEAAWSIPKGIRDDDADELTAVAEREFNEEMGRPPPPGPDVSLGSVRASGKRIHVFAREGDFDASTAVSNTFELEWPPRSGRLREFPEIDRAEWVATTDARVRLVRSQVEFVDRLVEHLRTSGRDVPSGP